MSMPRGPRISHYAVKRAGKYCVLLQNTVLVPVDASEVPVHFRIDRKLPYPCVYTRRAVRKMIENTNRLTLQVERSFAEDAAWAKRLLSAKDGAWEIEPVAVP